MLSFPFINYPYNSITSHKTYSYKNLHTNNYSKENYAKTNKELISEASEYTKKADIVILNEKNKKNSSNPNESEEFIFNLFGIKLYFDDLLIIALLFFLYSEGVNDNELFITLVLLLIS